MLSPTIDVMPLSEDKPAQAAISHEASRHNTANHDPPSLVSFLAQSDQPVSGPLSCGTSDRITQNSLCTPKALLLWECVVLSEACL